MKKSVIVSGMCFGTEFLTNLYKEIVNQGGTEEMVFEALKTGNELIPKFAEIILGTSIAVPFELKKNKSKFLNLISGNETLLLDAVDGSEILAEADDLFSYIDPDFRNYGADEKGQPTDETPVQVYEQIENATFGKIFGSFLNDLDKLCLSQHQIKNFVKKYRNWLRADGYATFFLFKSNNQFFVAYVRLISGGGLEVNVDRFGISDVWIAEDRRRVVVPQLAV